MNDPSTNPLDERILVLAPTARDSQTCRNIFQSAQIEYFPCQSIAEICREVARGAGAAVITVEAILGDKDQQLRRCLKAQPPWSDFPLVVLTLAGLESSKTLKALDSVGHMTLLQRPVQVATFLSMIQSCLRDRRRQYAVRDLLAERRQVTDALRQERERYRVTLRSIGDGVIATDIEGRVTFVNEVAEKLTGWNAPEAQGRPLEEVVHIVNETTRQCVPNPAIRALKEDVVVALDNYAVLISRDGNECLLDDSAAPIRGADGNIIGSVLIFRDITEKKLTEQALQNQEKRATTILESIADGFVALDASWCFSYVNRQAEVWLEHSRHDLLGKNHWEEYPQSLGTEVERNYRRVMAEKVSIEFEFYFPTHGRWYDIHAYPAAGGLAIYFRDISERKQVENTLREKEDRLQLLIGHATDYALVTMDVEGRILEWTGGAERITGWCEEEMRGQTSAVIYTPEDQRAGAPEEELRQAVKTGRSADKRWHVRKDGSQFFADGVLVSLHGPAQELRGFGKVFRDVTERKRAEEALARDALLLANVHDAVIVTNLDGVITYWNEGASRLFGWTAAEMLGRPYAERFPEPVRSWVIEEIQSRAAGVEWSGEYEDYRKDGTRVWIDARVTRVTDDTGTMIGILGLSHDITERKKAEEALKEADRRKDDFIALLAHELRNPLAPLRSGLQVLRLAGSNVKALAQARSMMDRQLNHMVRLIDDLLDISRIGRNKMELRRSRVLLADIISNAVETARPMIEASGHELSVSVPTQPIFLDADLTRLSQVFSNLLSNSAKYTEHGGRIWLQAELSQGEVIVSVRDTGIGIPPDALDSIFDMFSQIDRSIERSTGGLGIGLALVKGLVEMHGGTVSAASPGQDQGSTFTVRLPILEIISDAMEILTVDNIPSVRSAKRRLLVVDDNRDSATSMEMMLSLLGYEITLAHDGIEAVQKAERTRPDIILMDVGMPRLNGLDATRQIRSQPWGQSMIIIALTGWGQEGDRVQSKEAGCDGHLVKPVNLNDLETMLAELTAKSPRCSHLMSFNSCQKS